MGEKYGDDADVDISDSEQVMDETGMNEDIASKIIEHGLNGQMIEIAIMDNELDEQLKDMGFEFIDVAKLIKILKYDGWKTKQSYPVTMNVTNFGKWIEK